MPLQVQPIPLLLNGIAGGWSLVDNLAVYAQPGAIQSELTGYNVKRHEFDPEYDQDAECVIAELEFREDDTSVRAPSHPNRLRC